MPRYIDADAAKIDAEERGGTLWLTDGDVKEVKRFLDDQPTADVEPIVHAHWIRRTRDHRNDYYDVMEYPYRCSACREKSKEHTKRCHECGARMDEEVTP